MANANIFAQYLQAPQSVTSKIAALDEADFRRSQMEGAQRQNRLQELAFQRGEQDRAKALAKESAIRQLALESAGDEGKFASGLRRIGEFNTAADIEKAMAERAKLAAETDEARAGTKEKTWEQGQKERETAVRDIAMFNTPEDAIADVQAKLKSGVLDMQRASAVIKTIQTNPNWQLDLIRGILTPKDRLEADMKGRTEARQAANETLILDPKTGRYVVNQPLVEANKQIGAASAARTVVDMTGGQKGFENETKLRDNFKQEPVYKAHQEMDSAHRQIIDAINQKSPIGDMAAATKIMKLLDPGSVVRESELGMAMQATGMMDYLTNYAGNIINGTKLTPTQRKEFAELANALYAQSVEQYDKKRNEYIKLGGEYGLNADRALGTVARPAPPKAPKKGEAAPAAPPDIDALLKKYGGK
jgi:hypothetical protein